MYLILGTIGSGKSTLAQSLAKKVGAKHIELDDFYWKPGWVRRDPEEVVEMVKAAMSSKNADYIIEGFKLDGMDELLHLADTLIVLDVPLRVSLPRHIKRGIARIQNK